MWKWNKFDGKPELEKTILFNRYFIENSKKNGKFSRKLQLKIKKSFLSLREAI